MNPALLTMPTRTPLLLALALVFSAAPLAFAQTTPPVPPVLLPPTGAKPVTKGYSVHYPNMPLSQVLEDYQEMTGKRIIRDPKVENAVVTIETSGQLSKEEAIEFIEKSLLFSGYAFVPSGENMVKIIAVEAGRTPASERVDMVTREEDLPKSDTVVSFVLPLQYLKSDEAAQAFAQIIPNHSYGKITAVPNARALVITENSNTIRAYIDLAKQVDVPPGKTIHRTLQLERADAEEVAKALSELLGIGAGTAASSPGKATPPVSTQPRPPTNPQQAAALAAAQVSRHQLRGRVRIRGRTHKNSGHPPDQQPARHRPAVGIRIHREPGAGIRCGIQRPPVHFAEAALHGRHGIRQRRPRRPAARIEGYE